MAEAKLELDARPNELNGSDLGLVLITTRKCWMEMSDAAKAIEQRGPMYQLCPRG
ncbi:hypothetical protein K3495_g2764 [Podosphaera aphanis]|nr:hypothetical protein K3495_g2764 [Podosphaera aphanis]